MSDFTFLEIKEIVDDDWNVIDAIRALRKIAARSFYEIEKDEEALKQLDEHVARKKHRAERTAASIKRNAASNLLDFFLSASIEQYQSDGRLYAQIGDKALDDKLIDSFYGYADLCDACIEIQLAYKIQYISDVLLAPVERYREIVESTVEYNRVQNAINNGHHSLDQLPVHSVKQRFDTVEGFNRKKESLKTSIKAYKTALTSIEKLEASDESIKSLKTKVSQAWRKRPIYFSYRYYIKDNLMLLGTIIATLTLIVTAIGVKI